MGPPLSRPPFFYAEGPPRVHPIKKWDGRRAGSFSPSKFQQKNRKLALEKVSYPTTNVQPTSNLPIENPDLPNVNSLKKGGNLSNVNICPQQVYSFQRRPRTGAIIEVAPGFSTWEIGKGFYQISTPF